MFDADSEAVEELLFDLVLDDGGDDDGHESLPPSFSTGGGGGDYWGSPRIQRWLSAAVEEDEGTLLWRELVGSLGEDVDEAEENEWDS